MKSLFSIVLLAFVILLVPAKAAAQSAVAGVITDSLTNAPLLGANVYLVGTSLGAAADLNGKFRIAHVPEGSYKVRISYMGYATKVLDINTKTDSDINLTVRLKPQVIDGEEVVVTAQMRGQVAAINTQISSNTMVNVVSADRIRELPDANAAESVGRLPGISLIRNAGEASKIVIRGLEPKLNAITLNGVKIPSTSTTDRSVDLSMISSESLEGIEVFKATLPDMDAEAVGGVVNLKVKKAPEEQRIRLKFGPGYNQLASSFGDFKFSGEYSNRFFEKTFGLVATADYEKVNRNSESLRSAYNVLGLRDSVTGSVPIGGTSATLANAIETRKRFGASMTLDYALDNGVIWWTNYYSSTSRDPFTTTKQYDPKSDRIQYTVRDQTIELQGLSTALNGDLMVWGLNMDWVASVYRIINENPYDFSMTLWQISPFNTSTLNVDDAKTYIPAEKVDVNKIQLRDNYDRPNTMYQTDYTAVYNVKMPLDLGEFISGNIKVGGKYSRSERDNKADGNGQGQYYLGSSFITNAQKYYNKPLTLNASGQITSQNFIILPPGNESIVNDRFTLFPLFNRDILKDWAEQQRPNYFFDRNSLADSYDLEENIAAGYLMTELKLGTALSMVAGARYEHDNNRYSSVWTSAYEVYGRSGIQFDTTTTREYDHWFPHLHLKVQAMEGLDFRFSANRTLSRPDYYWISPWTRLDISNATIDRGNPALRETKVWNYNLSAYLYNNVTGFFSVSGFYKDLQDIFYRKRSQVFKQEDIIALNIPGREGGYQMTTYENADRAEVKGIEVEWQTQLAYYPGMPKILKGFVFNINYARIWSKTYFPFYKFNATIIPGSRPPRYTYDLTDYEREGPMPGQADHIVNLSMGYDIDRLSTRVSWTYQGSSISAVGEIAETDTWNKAFWRWDALVKYRFTDWLNLSVSFVNMSDQPDQSYYGAEDYPTSEFYYGMTGSASIEITL